MARRRMIGQNTWKDPEFSKLSDPERVLFLGIISNSDDEGRIIATPEALKADIFPYDHKKTARVVKKLRDSVVSKMKNVLLYTNNEVEYICLLRWKRYQKPKHFKPSILPTPPVELYPDDETEGETLGGTRSPSSSPPTSPPSSRPSLGQSSLGKASIGKVSEVKEDFTKFLDSEPDLTDSLMMTLNENISAGRAQVLAAEGGLGGDVPGELSPEQEATVRMNWGIMVLKKCWKDGIGEDIPDAIFDGARRALKQYPLEVVAKAFAKGVRYKGGKHKSWKYIQTIIDEEIEKRGHSPPHS